MATMKAVVDALNLQEGESILIHGGAGAVGYAALQTALYRGASKIYTTSLPADIDYLHELNKILWQSTSRRKSLLTLFQSHQLIVLLKSLVVTTL